MNLKRIHWYWAAFGVFTLVYYLCFIYRTSVWVDGKYHSCLFDDAMISMSYARNFVNGYGLNWARFGEPVEGFTNPLWTFLMIPLNILPIPLEYTSLVFQLFNASIQLFCLVMVYRISKILMPSASELLLLIPVSFTAFFYPLINWTLYGMETSMALLLALLASYHSLKYKESTNSKHAIRVAVYSSLAIFLRYDLAIIPFLCFLYLFFDLIRNLKLLVILVLIVLVPNLMYLCFRYFYFHDWLPNTYYLKMTGVDLSIRLKRGWEVFNTGFHTFRIPFLISVGYIIYSGNRRILFLLSFWVIYSIYAIYTGGDAWEYTFTDGYNRFQSCTLPFLFIVFSVSIFHFLAWMQTKVQIMNKLMPLVVIFLLWYLITDFNHLTKIPANNFNWRRVLLLERPMHMNEHDMVLANTLKMNQIATKDDVVAVVWAGIPAYFSDFKLVDILGYNDKRIAKMDMNPIAMIWYRFYYPGHMKWDYNYTLGVLKPRYLLQAWGHDFDENGQYPYLKKSFYWERVEN